MFTRRLFICVLFLFSFVILSAVPYTFAAMNPPSLLTPEDGAQLDPNKMEFRWTAVEGALFYKVEMIMEQNFQDIISVTRCDEPALTLVCEGCKLCKQYPTEWCPPGGFPNPMILHWRVYAVGDNETVSSETRVFYFNPGDINVLNSILPSRSNKSGFQLFQKINK
jgi:hypothetical protein